MRLWQKISVIAASVMLIVTSISMTLLIFESRGKILDMAERQTEEKLKTLTASVAAMTEYYNSYDLRAIDEQTIIKYCFGHFADEETVLTFEGNTIYSVNDIDPSEILTERDSFAGTETVSVKSGDKNIIIARGTLHFILQNYTVYVVRDVTDIYKSMDDMTGRFAAVIGIFLAAGTLLIIFLVRRTIKPLTELNKASKRIAEGEYSERAAVSSNDEAGELARNFNIMADAVEEHVESLNSTAKKQQYFISGLTHELKTPMASLMLHSEILAGAKMNGENARKSLMHIHSQIEWLNSLTQSMLSMITAKDDINIKECSVSALFTRVEGSISDIMRKSGITLDIGCRIKTLPINTELMQSLVINLVDNARKASKRGQTIKLSAYDNIIEVSDSGTGIPEEDLLHITEPFYMVDKSRSKKKGGSGLGLAIVKEIAAVHNAELVIKSKPGTGTTVKVVFKKYTSGQSHYMG